jgi:hypothetical protein
MNDVKATFEGIGKAWANPKAKKGLLITVGLMGILGGVAFLNLNKEKNAGIPSAARAAPLPTGSSSDALGGNAPPVYKDLVREADRKRAEEAAKDIRTTVLPSAAGLADSNKRAIDPNAGGVVPMRLPPLPQPQPTRPDISSGVVQQPVAQIQAPTVAAQQVSAADRQSYAQAQGLLNSFLQKANASGQSTSWNVVQPGTVRGSGSEMVPRGAQPGGTTGSSGSSRLQANARPIIRAGETYFATLDTAINTDYSGPVIATIRQGKYNGARLVGAKTLEFDAVSLKFTHLSPADGGPMFPISAFAITIEDATQFGLTGIKGDTDYHVMQRYVLPAIAAFAKGYAVASSIPRSTIGSTGGGIVYQQERLSSEDRLIVAAGAAMTPIQRDLDRIASRPITISLPANTEIGILFATDVMERGQIPDAGQSPPVIPMNDQAQQTTPRQPGAGVPQTLLPVVPSSGAAQPLSPASNSMNAGPTQVFQRPGLILSIPNQNVPMYGAGQQQPILTR